MSFPRNRSQSAKSRWRWSSNTTAGGTAKGGTITLLANGRKIGEGRVEKTTPFKYALAEGQDIGEDTGSPIDFSYSPPFNFTGKLGKVTVDLKPGDTRHGRSSMTLYRSRFGWAKPNVRYWHKADMSPSRLQCPLSGVKRTCLVHCRMSAYDP